LNLLNIDGEEFKLHFPSQGFRIKHELVDTDLFQLPRLVELANDLPRTSIEHNLGDVEISQGTSDAQRNNLTVAETIQQIEKCASWMVLKNVEQDATYKKLLQRCLAEVEPFSSPIVGDMLKIEGFIFISSPNSITPFHFDPEHNFLLQIKGQKTMSLFDRDDRELLQESSIEDRYSESMTRNLPFDDSSQHKAVEHVLLPGDGLFVPQNAPHWVKNGNKTSISFSITFRSRESERLARLYALNGQLRKMGLKPSQVMRSPTKDLIKDTLFRVYRKSKSVLNRG
jgi:hypothetical protein